MTDRKPAGMSFTSWIDQQISEAAERGAFDDLPGAGKPLRKRSEAEDAQAWLREYLRREGVSPDVLLPEPLRLRRELERLAEAAPGLRSEQAVRDAAAELNERIMRWRRIPLGPPIFVPLADEDDLVARWRAARHGDDAAATHGAGPAASHCEPRRPRRRWWRQRGAEPEATEPEATEPEATEPGATEPEATEPEATEPGATEPEAAGPEAAGPGDTP